MYIYNNFVVILVMALHVFFAFQAAYFCFVTISTIGFGDYVPGSSTFESADDNWKMILSSIYMMFGMAILSMCFALIQVSYQT